MSGSLVHLVYSVCLVYLVGFVRRNTRDRPNEQIRLAVFFSLLGALPQRETTLAGCSKSLSSKAAGESKPEAYPQGYVEDFDEPRTKLAGFFSILPLDIRDLPVNRWQIGINQVSVDL